MGTNGIISTQDFPRETQYVDDDFPTDFPAIAPFLADIDTSHSRGRILYREDTSGAVLSLAARYVRTGFPLSGSSFTPTHAFLATWEHVGAYEEVSRGAAPSGELNTFQAVLASDESDTYALFLYPANGLQFFGTRPKESYNVQLQLPARVGFCRGEADDLKREALYFSLTNTEQSVKNLYQLSNLGIPGVWAFHIGSRFALDNVRPATVGGDPSTARSSALEHPFSHAAALESYTEDSFHYYDENEEDVEYPPVEPGEAPEGHSRIDVSFNSKADPGLVDVGTSSPGSDRASPWPYPAPGNWPSYRETESASLDPQTKQGRPVGEGEVLDFRDPAELLDQMGTRAPAPPEADAALLTPVNEDLGGRNTQSYPEAGPVPSEPDVPVPPLEGEVLPHYPESGHVPPLRGGKYVIGLEDHVGSNDQVFTYNGANLETCEHSHGRCSQHAFCTDYTTGFCCHCQSRFYGNGKHCLPEGAPHRVNGKVSGRLRVGHIPVHFTDVEDRKSVV